MREPIPEVSSSTQPWGALSMNMWLSPSITTACFVAGGELGAVEADVVAVFAGVPAADALARAAKAPVTTITHAIADRASRRALAGARNGVRGRGIALSEHLRVGRGSARVNLRRV